MFNFTSVVQTLLHLSVTCSWIIRGYMLSYLCKNGQISENDFVKDNFHRLFVHRRCIDDLKRNFLLQSLQNEERAQKYHQDLLLYQETHSHSNTDVSMTSEPKRGISLEM